MKNSNETTHSIIDDTRHSIIDAIIAFGYIVGDLQYHEFAKKVCPTLSDSVLCDVARHMDRFDDYQSANTLYSVSFYKLIHYFSPHERTLRHF